MRPAWLGRPARLAGPICPLVNGFIGRIRQRAGGRAIHDFVIVRCAHSDWVLYYCWQGRIQSLPWRRPSTDSAALRLPRGYDSAADAAYSYQMMLATTSTRIPTCSASCFELLHGAATDTAGVAGRAAAPGPPQDILALQHWPSKIPALSPSRAALPPAESRSKIQNPKSACTSGIFLEILLATWDSGLWILDSGFWILDFAFCSAGI